MQVGVLTIDGQSVGVISLTEGGIADPFVPDLDGYVPQGRAGERSPGDGDEPAAPRGHGGGEHHAPHDRHTPSGRRPGGPDHRDHGTAPRSDSAPAPEGRNYDDGQARQVRQGSVETDQAIRDAAQAHGLDVNTMRSIASIESSMNPSSNANRSTQYKGLYQIGREEWRRFGEGNIYSAHDNAMAAARMFEANRNQFRGRFGRTPTDTELYMMHQQGLGFYTRGAMTNIGGNPYPGMRGAQTSESFERGWGRELARRKAGFGSAPVAEDVTQTAPMAGDFEGLPGLGEQFTGTPNWGWDKGEWKNLHKSPNVQDRRNVPGGWTTKQLEDMKANKIKGDAERAKGGEQPSSLSKQAGWGDIAEPRLDAVKNAGGGGNYPSTVEEFKKKYGRDPATDAELEFYNK